MRMTDYLALYAAVLSTIVFVWNIRSSRPKFKVEVIFGVQDGENPRFGVYVVIQNASSQKVHIRSLTLLSPYRKVPLLERLKYAFVYKRVRYVGWVHHTYALKGVETGLPVTIEPHSSHSVFIEDSLIWKMLEEDGREVFAASVQDALWTTRISKTFEMPRPKDRAA